MGSKFGILPNLEILGKIHHAAMLSQGGVDLAPVNFRFADDSRRSSLQPGWSLCANNGSGAFQKSLRGRSPVPT
jgi:hypothetical protein